jgi:hypothetical protein
MQDQTQEIIDGNYKSSQGQLDLRLKKPIFNELLESDLPAEEKLHSRLWQEGLVVCWCRLRYDHIYSSSNKLPAAGKARNSKRLKAELESVLPDKFCASTVECYRKASIHGKSGIKHKNSTPTI